MKYQIKVMLIGAASILIGCMIFGFGKALPRQDERPITLTEFKKRVAGKEKLVLVYFSADWCMVCAKIKPIIDSVEKQYKEKVDVLRINTDRDKEVAAEFEVDALPIFILYKNNCREWIHVGLIEKKELNTTLNAYLQVK